MPTLRCKRSGAIRRADARVQNARRHLRGIENDIRRQEAVLTDSQLQREEAANALRILRAQQKLLLIARDYLELEEARSRRR